MLSRLLVGSVLLGMIGGSFVAMAQDAPRFLTASELSIATGKPSLVTMTSGSTHVPVWSLSGGTEGQSVAGVVPGFSADYAGVQVEIVVTTNEAETNASLENVYRVHLSQLNASGISGYTLGKPVRTALSNAPFQTRTIVLESFYPVTPNVPLVVRIQREPGDPADTFTRPDGLVLVKVTPLKAPAKAHLVQDVPGYNSWPVVQALGDKLVCVYSRGTAHTIDEDLRAVYARTSTDAGKTWSPETVVANTPGGGEVTIGKGLDSKGAMLLWVRRIGKGWNHDLYRTTDGVTFTHLATPKFDVVPIQITDVFHVPKVGLMALWFAGKYDDNGPCHAWGTLTSSDDGATWTQHVVESELTREEWPTEPSAVSLGDGTILAVARSEMGGPTTVCSQFQMVSRDGGRTWKRFRTNIGDVLASTPSLIYDAATGLLSNYYYERGRGVLRRRVVRPDDVLERPLAWPASEAVALGSAVTFDAGNVNATFLGNTHFLAYYSGKGANTSVLVATAFAPTKK
ncbi:MAG: sialidase family protein [Planctomycetia bacterium]|nr:sialidase family protein [Planctomycetia bacterium]